MDTLPDPPGVTTDDKTMQDLIATFFFVAYLFLVIVAMCGAVSIIFIVVRYRNLRSRAINFYYVNMAFADLFLASLGAPFRAVYYLNIKWTFGHILCQWFEYAENLAYFVHVYSLMVASFLVLQDVMLARRSFRRTEQQPNTCLRSYVVSSFGIWTFGILTCLPYVTHRSFVGDSCLYSAKNIFLIPEKVFGPFVLIVVPITITIVTILLIICCACSTNSRVESTYQENVLSRAHKSTRHISLFLWIYILCQIPHTALKWFKVEDSKQNDTLQFCAAGLRLSCACFSAALFCYISEEKVMFNVRHAMKTLNAKRPNKPDNKVPLRSVSDIQYQEIDRNNTPNNSPTPPQQQQQQARRELASLADTEPQSFRYSTVKEQPETYV